VIRRRRSIARTWGRIEGVAKVDRRLASEPIEERLHRRLHEAQRALHREVGLPVHLGAAFGRSHGDAIDRDQRRRLAANLGHAGAPVEAHRSVAHRHAPTEEARDDAVARAFRGAVAFELLHLRDAGIPAREVAEVGEVLERAGGFFADRDTGFDADHSSGS
jgi:hypothetical protein